MIYFSTHYSFNSAPVVTYIQFLHIPNSLGVYLTMCGFSQTDYFYEVKKYFSDWKNICTVKSRYSIIILSISYLHSLRVTWPPVCTCAGVSGHGPGVSGKLQWANQSRHVTSSWLRRRASQNTTLQIHMPFHLRWTLSRDAAAIWFFSPLNMAHCLCSRQTQTRFFLLFSSFSPFLLKSHLGDVIWVNPVKGKI